MASLSEDELLQALTWTDESYSLSEFVSEFSLPQVVKVVRGYDGGTASSTIGYGEVLTLHALRETRVLAAEDKNDNAISIGFDLPREFQILPQTKDCSLNSCGVTDLLSFYLNVKYIEVIQANYGTADDVDSTVLGELLEIIEIHKPNKPEKAKVQVRNLESGQKSTLTSTCTARFRPLLDWKRYKAADLKTQYGFPVRVRFLDPENEVEEDEEYQRFISRSPDINVIAETEDILVISTVVGGGPDLKLCYEIPKGLEIKVAVAEGFSTGAKHYTDTVSNLNERFDVAKFLVAHQPALIKWRDVIKQHDYGTIKKYIMDKSMGCPQFDDVQQDPGAPELPPRKPIGKANSLDLPHAPPVVPRKPSGKKDSDPSIETSSRKQKPAVPHRVRSSSHNSSLNSSDGVASMAELQNGSCGNSPVASTDVVQSINGLPNSPPQPEDKGHGDTKPQVKSPRPSNRDSQLNKIDESSSENSEGKTPLAPSKIPARKTHTYQNVSQSTKNHPDPSQGEEENRGDGKPQIKPRKPPSSHPKVPDASPDVPQNLHDHPNYRSQFEEKDNPAKRPTQVTSPKLPPRNPKAPDGATNALVASPDVLQTRNGHLNYPSQFEQKDNAVKRPSEMKKSSKIPSPRQPTRDDNVNSLTEDEDNDDYLMPVFPPKFPAESKKFPGNAWKVLPVSPNVPGYPKPDTQSPKPPYTPPCTRNLIDRGIQRVGTLPKHFKFGNDNPDGYSGQDDASLNDPESEDLYEELTVIPTVMPVAPQPITKAEKFVREENPYELVAKIPQDLSGLSIGQVSDILRNLNMAEYAERFEDEMIDGNLLKELKEDELESFQMTSLHRTKLLKFIKGWRPTYQSKQHTT